MRFCPFQWFLHLKMIMKIQKFYLIAKFVIHNTKTTTTTTNATCPYVQLFLNKFAGVFNDMSITTCWHQLMISWGLHLLASWWWSLGHNSQESNCPMLRSSAGQPQKSRLEHQFSQCILCLQRLLETLELQSDPVRRKTAHQLLTSTGQWWEVHTTEP